MDWNALGAIAGVAMLLITVIVEWPKLVARFRRARPWYGAGVVAQITLSLLAMPAITPFASSVAAIVSILQLPANWTELHLESPPPLDWLSVSLVLRFPFDWATLSTSSLWDVLLRATFYLAALLLLDGLAFAVAAFTSEILGVSDAEKKLPGVLIALSYVAQGVAATLALVPALLDLLS